MSVISSFFFLFLCYSPSSTPTSPTKRTAIAHHYFDVDASQILWIVKKEISPLKKAISFFIEELKIKHSDFSPLCMDKIAESK